MNHSLLVNEFKSQQHLPEDLGLTESIHSLASVSCHLITQGRRAQLRLNVERSVVFQPCLLIAHDVKRPRVVLLTESGESKDLSQHPAQRPVVPVTASLHRSNIIAAVSIHPFVSKPTNRFAPQRR